MSAWADRIARSWAALYTRGLPEDTAERRREEICSDLFEHAHEAGITPAQQVDVLGRVLWGIPADLSWRRAARAPRERRLATGEPMTLKKTTTVVVIAYAIFNLAAGLGVLTGAGAEDGDAGSWQWSLPMVAGAAMLAGALRYRDDAPRLTTVLMIVGAAAPMVTMFWMAPIFAPFWLLISGLAIASEPGRRAPAAAV